MHRHRHHHRRETLAHEMTATRAYFLWQRAGRPAGRDWEFWFEAETMLAFEFEGYQMAHFNPRRAVDEVDGMDVVDGKRGRA